MTKKETSPELETNQEPTNYEEFKQKLEDSGVDASKIIESYQSPVPIHRHSACDVFRNNKIFLNHLARMGEHESLYEDVREKFGAKTKQEADEQFEKSNQGIPFGWYNKLNKIYQSFRHVFSD